MDSIQKIASLLHILICQKPHDPDHMNIGINDGNCHFYAEEQLTSCWNEPDHQSLIRLAEDFVASCNLENDAEGQKKATIILEDIRDACKKVAFLTTNCPKLTTYITAILGRSMQEPSPTTTSATTTTAPPTPRRSSGGRFLNPKEFLDC